MIQIVKKQFQSDDQNLRMQQKIKLGLGGAHLPFPGIGHFRSEGTGYVWVPLEYSPYGTNLSSK